MSYGRRMVLSCPRCGQGNVATYRVHVTGERVSVCDECDALWPDGVTIGPTGFEDLTDFLRAQGRPGDWSELAALDS